MKLLSKRPPAFVAEESREEGIPPAPARVWLLPKPCQGPAPLTCSCSAMNSACPTTPGWSLGFFLHGKQLSLGNRALEGLSPEQNSWGHHCRAGVPLLPARAAAPLCFPSFHQSFNSSGLAESKSFLMIQIILDTRNFPPSPL